MIVNLFESRSGQIFFVTEIGPNCLQSLSEDKGAQWLSGRVLDSRPRGRRFKPHQCHCIVSLSKNINPSLVLVQPRKTSPFITERLLMGRKESKQTKQNQKTILVGKEFIRFLRFSDIQVLTIS